MRRLKLHYEGTNIKFNEARQKMAIVPTNSDLIDNPVSAAPGYKIENLFVFAGVPKIMQGMFNSILNELKGGKKLKSKICRRKSIKCKRIKRNWILLKVLFKLF